MPRNDIDRIKQKIRLRQYDMSAHAMEEMAEDLLTILDIEEAILSGQIIRVEKDDLRGTKYVVVGTALDRQTPVSKSASYSCFTYFGSFQARSSGRPD